MFSSTAHNAFSMWYASTVGGLRPRGGPLRDEEVWEFAEAFKKEHSSLNVLVWVSESPLGDSHHTSLY